MQSETDNHFTSTHGGKNKHRRVWIAIVLLTLVSLSCVCSTDNLPDFITNLTGQENAPATVPPDSTVILTDDFIDAGSGWEVAEFDSGSVGYTNGKYFVISTETSAAMWGVAGRNYTDVIIEVDATQVAAPSNNNNDYGVMCRLQNIGEGYSFNLSGDGFYSIQKMVNSEFSDLVAWTESSAIKKGNATNRIRATCQGNTLSLVVNGELLAEVMDSSYTDGDIALTATTYELDPTEIHFDNLTVRKP